MYSVFFHGEYRRIHCQGHHQKQNHQREYDTIDDTIAQLEQQVKEVEAQLLQSTSDYVKLQELSAKKEQLEQELEEKMERWVYLNDLAERIANGEMIEG